MSLLYQIVFTSACRGTHQRLALDALRHLRIADADRWVDLLLHHHAAYRAGAIAPDQQFKDFQNHVLFVGEGGWGGAIGAARRWYGQTVDALRRQAWGEAAFAAGALSHYFSDPAMPLHTARSEGAVAVHRAVEWSVSQSYGELQQILEHDLGGYPRVLAPTSDDWLARLIEQHAEIAHEHYQAVLDHFDLAAAVKDPRSGMDQECKDRLALCLGCAVVGFARVLERAIAESAAEPPPVEITLQGFLATLAAPVRWLLGGLSEAHERLVVEAIYDEVTRTGKVLQNLPEDDRTVRQLHAEEVLKIPLAELDARPAEPTGTRHGQDKPPRPNPNRLITAPAIEGRETAIHELRRRPPARRLAA
jgi:hypothetical protein